MKPGKPPSMLPQAILAAVLVGPLFVLMECNSSDRIEPSTPLAKSFQADIEAAVDAAYGSKVHIDCAMHGNVNFLVSCRAPASMTQNLQAHLLATGWVDVGDNGVSGKSVLRKGNRQITIEPMPRDRMVSVSMRMALR